MGAMPTMTMAPTAKQFVVRFPNYKATDPEKNAPLEVVLKAATAVAALVEAIVWSQTEEHPQPFSPVHSPLYGPVLVEARQGSLEFLMEFAAYSKDIGAAWLNAFGGAVGDALNNSLGTVAGALTIIGGLAVLKPKTREEDDPSGHLRELRYQLTLESEMRAGRVREALLDLHAATQQLGECVLTTPTDSFLLRADRLQDAVDLLKRGYPPPPRTRDHPGG